MTTELGFCRVVADVRAGLPRVWIERLEGRVLLAYSYSFDDGLLIIRGTSGPDDIGVTVSQWSQGYPKWGPAVGAGLAIVGNGAIYNLERNLIRAIRIEGGGGNDEIWIEDNGNGYDLSITVLGGAGDDTIFGAAWSELLDGEEGNDSIDGGGGDDVLPDAAWEKPHDPAIMRNRRGGEEARAEVIDGILHVTTGDDVDDIMLGRLPADGEIYVSVNSIRRVFNRAGLAGIVIDAQGGDDYFTFHNFGSIVELPVTVIGGAGNDFLAGQRDRDAVDHFIDLPAGGIPPSTLIGGEGDDVVMSGIGGGVIDGGAGVDEMRVWGEAPVTVLDEAEPAPEPIEPQGPFGGSEDEVEVKVIPEGVAEERPEADEAVAIVTPLEAVEVETSSLFEEDGAGILGSADKLLG